MKIYGFLLSIILLYLLVGCGGGISGSDNQPPEAAKLSIYTLPVGQGDSTFIEMPDGWTILIDGGQWDDVLTELPKVMRNSDRKINQLVLTHPDEDHLHGLLEVLRRYEVDEIWETGVNSLSPDYPIWHKIIKDRGIRLKKIYAGEIAVHGGASIDVIGPTKSMDGVFMIDPNNSSIVMKIKYGNFDALLTGDALVEEQSAIIGEIGAQDFLKVPHHGARNAAYEPLWQRARPEIAVLTVSDLSHYIGIPSTEVEGYMNKYAKKSYRTDKNGIITVRSDGVRMEVESEY